MESDGFLKLSPPKSTGRERYGTDYVKRLLSKAEILNLNPPDIVATATGQCDPSSMVMQS